MPVEDKFIKLGLKKVELETFLEKELGRAGFGGMEIKRLPLGTHVTIYVERPGMVIGKRGRSINQLTEELEKRFGIEKPQLEVVEIQKPELCAPIMAKRIAFALERGVSVRRAGYMMLRRIMGAGARGVEVVIGGKIAGERKKSIRFYTGYLSKTGEPAKHLVSYGYAAAGLRPGTVGVKVRIMLPEIPTPDEIKVKSTEEEPKGEEGGEAQGE